jgi:3-oxoacyl-[acyl-carrier protein] reductase
VNIGSYAGRAGGPGQAAYAAAKAGLIGLTAALAAELAGQNVRVNVVLPGMLPTPMTARLSAAAQARLVAANRLGRMNAVEEVARFVVFLCGLQNVSGQVFQLDSRPARWG